MLSLRPTILLFTLILLVAVVFVAADDINTTPPSEEDDNSSSEETVEDSNESRRKRSLETSLETNNKGEEGKMTGRAGIPGLPDPATILKIAQILQALGEKIVPILVEGNSAASLVAEKVGKDYKFVKNFKKELDSLTDELKPK
uniref:Uncharacterized protein n=1 Tax=Ceratitis capitata TaxID=7213 RepID=W8C944_CERCA